MAVKFLTRKELKKLIDQHHDSVKFVQKKKNHFNVIDNYSVIRRFNMHGAQKSHEWKMKIAIILLTILTYILINVVMFIFMKSIL